MVSANAVVVEARIPPALAVGSVKIKEKSGFSVTITTQMKETVCFSEMLYFARCKAANFGGWEMLLMEYG